MSPQNTACTGSRLSVGGYCLPPHHLVGAKPAVKPSARVPGAIEVFILLGSSAHEICQAVEEALGMEKRNV